MPRVIGLCGEIGSGKSVIAQILSEDHGFVRLKMTDPLNAMLRALGLNDYDLEGDGKEKPCAVLVGATPRHAQQTLGTEWGRNLIAPNIWTMHWSRAATDVLDHGGRVVCCGAVSQYDTATPASSQLASFSSARARR